MRSRFRLAAAIVALLSTFLVANPVAAAGPWTVFYQSGTNAYAYTSDCIAQSTGTVTCEGRSLDVFEGKLRAAGEPNRTTEQTCYSEFRETFDADSGAFQEHHAVFGCEIGAGTLSPNGLTTITLAPTTIQLTAIDCDATDCSETPAGSVVVDGTWTGVGPTFSQKGRSKFDDGSCLHINADRSKFRSASFVGSFEAMDAQIHEGTFTFRTDCSFEG